MSVAAVLALGAIILVTQLKFEVAFVVAALGAVAWFLNYRAELKEKLLDEFDDEHIDEELNSDEE
ncbi:MAG TPA: hypothetical protein VIG25_20110 [Pyrinomonadaceae bacterium]